MRRVAFVFLAGLVVTALALMAIAQRTTQASAGWSYPVIKGYGEAMPLPQAAVQPDKGKTYKVLFNLTRAGDSPSEVLPGLDHAARTLNVFSILGVPQKNVQMVMVFHGPGGMAALNNQAYRAKFKVDNPNIKVIQELRQAGVEAYVCGQWLHGANYTEKDLLPEVKEATSAMVVLVKYQNDGYALMPF